MTRPLSDLYGAFVAFEGVFECRYRAGYDNDNEPGVKELVGGAQNECQRRSAVDLAVGELIEACEGVDAQFKYHGCSLDKMRKALAQLRKALEGK